MHSNEPKDTANHTRRALLGGIALTALLPAVGCSSPTTSRRKYASSAPSPRWPEISADQYTPPRPLSPPTNTPPADSAVFHRRSEWATASPIPRRMEKMLPVRRLTVHHDGMAPVDLRSARDVSGRIDIIRRAHQQRGWGDIGYHYVVDPLGEVWEGRPLTWQGAHVASQNHGNLGVLVLGNFQRQQPTPAQLSALDRFVASRMATYNINLSSVYTHQELAPTQCPGRSLQSHMASTRRPTGHLAMLTVGRRSIG